MVRSFDLKGRVNLTDGGFDPNKLSSMGRNALYEVAEGGLHVAVPLGEAAASRMRQRIAFSKYAFALRAGMIVYGRELMPADAWPTASDDTFNVAIDMIDGPGTTGQANMTRFRDALAPTFTNEESDFTGYFDRLTELDARVACAILTLGATPRSGSAYEFDALFVPGSRVEAGPLAARDTHVHVAACIAASILDSI